MGRLYKKIHRVAAPPGSLEDNAAKTPVQSRITLIDYDAKSFSEKDNLALEDCFDYKDKPTVTWINIVGQNLADVQAINERFGVHPLICEDIVHLGQRPKWEDFGDYYFVVLSMLYGDDEEEEVVAEQISLLVGRNYVISFQETPKDIFGSIRERLRTAKGRIRQERSDYLAYCLIDAIVDNYFVVLEKIGDAIEGVDEAIMEETFDQGDAQDIYEIKRDLIFLRKQTWPVREIISGMLRSETQAIGKTTRFYLRDVYDHTIQVVETIEAFREMTGGLQDIYLSFVSNRMNEIMKVLTIFAVIFSPLSFLAGVYGMNFRYMPELEWRYGYFAVLTVMVGLAGMMLWIFRRKGWL